MASPDYFSDPPLCRNQDSFFSPSLDVLIEEEDPVRLFDEVMRNVDWGPWEARYSRRRGRPPIHPRVVCSAIVWGLLNGIRSSRKLEAECSRRLDFIWLLEGHKLDHSTIANFRNERESELMSLFQHVLLTAQGMGLLNLGIVAFDGTRVRANNSRYKTRTGQRWEQLADEYDVKFQTMLEEWKTQDRKEQRQFDDDEDKGGGGTPLQLPPHLADADARRQRLREAANKAKKLDELRRSQGVDATKNPAQVPNTDTDSRVMPNKEGGFAPNYTPTMTTDANGFVLDCDVTDLVNETYLIHGSLDRIERLFDQLPKVMMSDAGNNAGSVIDKIERRNVTYLVPVTSNLPQAGSPVLREDLKSPVPREQWRLLPQKSGKLAKSCFVYVEEDDTYYCPNGQPLHYAKQKSYINQEGERTYRRIYRCDACDGCDQTLRSNCLQISNKHGRTITRDEYEHMREATAERMSQPEVKAQFDQRSQIAETPFGYVKSQLNIRQFLLRGLQKVKQEWRWAATAMNIGKLIRKMATSRANVAVAT